MSRRRSSARIPARRRREPIEEEQELVATFSRKRKAEEPPEMEEVAKRRQQFQIQNQWVPISETDTSKAPPTEASFTTATTTIPTLPPTLSASSPETISPHKNNITPQELLTVWTGKEFTKNTKVNGGAPEPPLPAPSFRNLHPNVPTILKDSPLPSLQWADSREVWQLMLKKEEQFLRDPSLLERHPSLQPRMRAILLDWLIEVCEVYRLHRESFYLAADFIDRYLSITQNHLKQQLQLVGITALFVAAKLEEIYPPKLVEFAFVTDGACTENEILAQELVMLKALKWDLSPMTPTSWLNIYLQLVNADTIEEHDQNFFYPQYSSHAFIQIARLLDLCILDMECLQFPYSILATAALYHLTSDQVAQSVSGYTWLEIAPCVQWMAPYATTLREAGPAELKFFNQVAPEATHNIQTHAVDLALLEKAQALQKQVASAARFSPDVSREFPGIVTPPQSAESKPSRNSTEHAESAVLSPQVDPSS